MTLAAGVLTVLLAVGSYLALRRLSPEPAAGEPLTRLRTPAAARGTILTPGLIFGPLDDAELLEIEARFRSAEWARRLYVLPPGATFSLVVHAGEP